MIGGVVFWLEEGLEQIKEDEYVEVSGKSMGMGKVIVEEREGKRGKKR